MKEKYIIKSPIIINPFFYYAAFWILSIFLYITSPSKLNNKLMSGLVIFLILTIFISIILSKYFNKKIQNLSISIFKPNTNVLLVLAFILLILYFMEFLYSNQIPIINYLNGNDVNYKDFGIPTIHVFIVTFSYFISMFSFTIFAKFKLKTSLLLLIICILYFICIFSRGGIIFIIFINACIYLAEKKITIKKVSILVIFLIIFAFVFGIIGNIRSGYNPLDSYPILDIANIDGNRNSILSLLFWVDEYLICSLRNLNYNISLHNSNYNFIYLFINFFPDFLSKRILSSEPNIFLINEGLTTCTSYITSYIYGGYLGMLFCFLLYIILSLIIINIKFNREICKIYSLSILTFIFGLTFFDNMLVYSGYSFTLIYPIILSIVTKKRLHRIVGDKL